MSNVLQLNPNLAKLPKNWHQTLAQEYLEGASDTEIRATLRMTKSLWDTLYDDPTSSEFKEVVDFGRMLAKAWWLTQARKSLKDRTFNANLWFMVMKNQFGWSEKTLTTTAKEASDMSQDELDQRVREAMVKFGKAVKG